MFTFLYICRSLNTISLYISSFHWWLYTANLCGCLFVAAYYRDLNSLPCTTLVTCTVNKCWFMHSDPPVPRRSNYSILKTTTKHLNLFCRACISIFFLFYHFTFQHLLYSNDWRYLSSGHHCLQHNFLTTRAWLIYW